MRDDSQIPGSKLGGSSSSRVESIFPLITEVAPSIFDNLSGDYEREGCREAIVKSPLTRPIAPNRFRIPIVSIVHTLSNIRDEEKKNPKLRRICLEWSFYDVFLENF